MEEHSCLFLRIFEINGLSLQSVYQPSKVGNTQQAGTRIHSCIPATGHRQNTWLKLNVTKETETNGIRSRMGQKPSLRFHSINLKQYILITLSFWFLSSSLRISPNFNDRVQADWRFTQQGVDCSMLVGRVVTWR